MTSKSTSSTTVQFDPQDKFIEAVDNFLKALLHKFRKDADATQKLKTQHSRLHMMVISASEKVRKTAGKKLVMTFHETMSPFYQRIMNMDKQVIFKIKQDMLTELDFPKLFSQCSEKVQTIMFKHLQTICRYSSLCASTNDIPGGVMSQVYGISAKMAEAQRQGKSVNFSEVWQQAEKIVKSAEKSDQKAIARSMKEGGMHNLMNMVMGGSTSSTSSSRKSRKKKRSNKDSNNTKRSRKHYSDSESSGSSNDSSDSD